MLEAGGEKPVMELVNVHGLKVVGVRYKVSSIQILITCIRWGNVNCNTNLELK